MSRELGLITTFYSYKGGVGRSFILANIAATLADWGHRVLCVDWDLEAPGLHKYFDKWLAPESASTPGIVELVQQHADRKAPNWRDCVCKVTLKRELPPQRSNGSNSPVEPKYKSSELSLIRAGITDDSYARRVQQLDWTKLYEEHFFGEYVEQLREEWQQEFDFIFLDSRTGITDIGGICTIQFPDVLATVFVPNHQSVDGAFDVARKVIKQRSESPYGRARPIVLPILSRLSMREEYQLANSWISRLSPLVAEFYGDWVNQNVAPEELLRMLYVPHFSYWNFDERLPVIEESRQDAESVNYFFHTLAALIGNRFSQTDLLVRMRDQLVQTQSSLRLVPEASPKQYANSQRSLPRVHIVHLPWEIDTPKLLRSVLVMQGFEVSITGDFVSKDERNFLSGDWTGWHGAMWLDALKSADVFAIVIEGDWTEEALDSFYREFRVLGKSTIFCAVSERVINHIRYKIEYAYDYRLWWLRDFRIFYIAEELPQIVEAIRYCVEQNETSRLASRCN